MPHILVIEDHEGIREGICDMLHMAGFDVSEAKTGLQGRELALAEDPDLILCDVMLPELDGFRLVEQLRQMPAFKLTPIIFMSSKIEDEARRHGMRLGADDYLVKPLKHDDLLDTIYTRLERLEVIRTAQDARLNAARTAFLRMVSHELRTPLINISMIQEIFNRQLANLTHEQMQDFLDSLGGGTRRMQHLVEQTIYLVQLESGALSLEAIHANGIQTQPWFLLKAAVDLARKFSVRGQNCAEVKLSEDVSEAEINCMPDALKHAWAELITNAMNFTPPDGRIEVSQWQSRNHLWVNVLDTGPGMASEDINRAQDLFAQINRDTREQQGAGLGIPVAHHIITAHGGGLEFRSVQGEGTQVRVRLPLAL